MISDEAMQIWKTETHKPLHKTILEAIISAINRDRNGEIIDRENLRKVIQTYKDMGMKKPVTQMSDGLLLWVGEKNT
jgi:hypothetical protein